MGQNSKIEWTDHTWNPWRGCAKVSEGCKNCYAEVSTPVRVARGQGRELWGKGKGREKTTNWNEPRKWNEPRVGLTKGFVTCPDCRCDLEAEFQRGSNIPLVVEICGCGSEDTNWTHRPKRVFPSLCDWLDEEVPIEWLAAFLKLIHETPNLDWLLLTKRPENFKQRIFEAGRWLYENNFLLAYLMVARWKDGIAPDNVWVGVSVENQAMADKRIPLLLEIPAALRFLSVEPLLGPVDLRAAIKAKEACPRCTPPTDPGCPYCLGTGGVPVFHGGLIHWVILGGESGKGARTSHVDWYRSGVKQCMDAGVKVFVKQLGSVCDMGFDVCGKNGGWRGPSVCWNCSGWKFFKHPKGGDPAEWPEDLRIRQFPESPRLRASAVNS